MQILITNDDGIESPGLHALANHMQQYGDVTVFAPSCEYSGAGTSIGHLVDGINDVYRVQRDEMPNVKNVYHLDGPPALTVLLAVKGIFGHQPDLVVSGINPGANIGLGIHFSGTVGGGIAAAALDVPAIAVSLQGVKRQGFAHWDTAIGAVAKRVPDVIANPRFLNINAPNVPPNEVAGTRTATLSHRLPWSLHNPTITPTDDDGRFSVAFDRYGPYQRAADSDAALLDHGYITVTELAIAHQA